MKLDDVVIMVGAGALAYFLVKWSRRSESTLQGYFRYANSAPPGFVYDPVLDGWARTRQDGVKEVYV